MSSFTIGDLRFDQDSDLKAWDALVDESPVPDIYFRPGYVWACRETVTESIRAVVIDASGFRCLIPLMTSSIFNEGTGSTNQGNCAYPPYGYGGLLPLDSTAPPTREQIAALREALQEWGRENNVVCVVVRLHPLFHQEDWFDCFQSGDTIVFKGNATIAVGLEDWNEEGQCIATLNKGRRTDLKVGRRNLRLTWNGGMNEGTCESLRIFQSLYDDHMRSIGAKEFYFFPETYYADLVRGLDHRLSVGIAWRDNDPVGGSLFMADVRFAHYHLSACNLIGYENKASTLLVNEGASWARGRGCSQLHLGGGLKADDSLFKFKQSFGGKQFRYGTVTIVADHAAFNTLCNRPDVRWPFAMHRQIVDSGTLS